MSELTDLIIQFGNTFGWSALLFVLFAYQLFWPSLFHPSGGTKLQTLLREPNPAVVAVLVAISEETSQVDDRTIKEWFNGSRKWTEDVKVAEKETLKKSE